MCVCVYLTADVSDEAGEEGVACDVEWHPQSHVARPMQRPARVAVCNTCCGVHYLRHPRERSHGKSANEPLRVRRLTQPLDTSPRGVEIRLLSRHRAAGLRTWYIWQESSRASVST